MRVPAPVCVPPKTVTPGARAVSRSPMFETACVSTMLAAFTFAIAFPTSMRRCSPVAVVTTGVRVIGVGVIVKLAVAAWPAVTVTCWRAST